MTDDRTQDAGLRERIARIIEGYQPYEGKTPEQAADAILALLPPAPPPSPSGDELRALTRTWREDLETDREHIEHGCKLATAVDLAAAQIDALTRDLADARAAAFEEAAAFADSVKNYDDALQATAGCLPVGRRIGHGIRALAAKSAKGGQP